MTLFIIILVLFIIIIILLAAWEHTWDPTLTELAFTPSDVSHWLAMLPWLISRVLGEQVKRNN